ncbi:MAG: DUF559 domain-containing protein [Candidatus Parcubacteria bacterium]|nr:DUF559 domain-containing protein [Candidatus Parcubacteria bacterium]
MQLFNLKLHKEKRRLLRNKMTPAEVAIWVELKNEKLGYKFRRQYGVGHYIIDFYCPKLKFALELDGDVHTLEHVHIKDLIREKFIKDCGITIKRYWNHQVLEDVDSVLEELVYICKKLDNRKISPRTSPEPLLGK